MQAHLSQNQQKITLKLLRINVVFALWFDSQTSVLI